MTRVPDEHRKEAPRVVRCVVVTVSDTRTRETDKGGDVLESLLRTGGHEVVDRTIIPDDPARIETVVNDCVRRDDVDAVFLTGGTGLGSRDHTYETVSRLITREIPGYGELFRMLSFREIGPAAMLSRATAGLIGTTLIVTTPGSPGGVRTAIQDLILPELGHVIREARK
ncbi:MAG: MogA/MoaB family molybdenum cofactor biosynthesis protein [Planctomycetota bacterium]|nr:MAG: MogA/MoaB family molybdenum cofactor biosynthesis protein [Planctomycetota bacterium]